MVDLVSSRMELQARGRQPPDRPVPVSRRAHAVVRDQPGREGLPLLRLPGLGRRVHVRHGDRGRRLQGRARAASPTATRSRSSSRTRTRRRPSSASAASGCSSCSSARRRSTCASCGSPREAARAREYLAERGLRGGDAARVSRRLRAERVGHRAQRLAARRLRQPRALRRRPGAEVAEPAGASTTASARRSSSRSPTRAGACAASPGARSAATDDRRPKYVNSPESELFHKGQPAVRRRPRARGRRRRPAERRRRRGLHGRHRDAPGRACATRVGDHGHGADRGPDRRARAPRARGPARARRRQRRQGGDAARRARSPPGASRRCACASSRCRPARTPRTSSSATGGEEIAAARRGGRAVRALPRPAARSRPATSATAEGRDRVLDELRDVFSLLEPSAEREELRADRRRSAWTSRRSCSSRCSRARRRARAGAAAAAAGGAARRRAGAAPARSSAAASPTERSFLALCIALPELGAPGARRARPRRRPHVATSRAARPRTCARTSRSPTDGLDERRRRAASRSCASSPSRAAAMTAAATPRLRDRAPAARARARSDREIAAARAQRRGDRGARRAPRRAARAPGSADGAGLAHRRDRRSAPPPDRRAEAGSALTSGSPAR